MSEIEVHTWLKNEQEFLKKHYYKKGRVTLDFCDVKALGTERILKKILEGNDQNHYNKYDLK